MQVRPEEARDEQEVDSMATGTTRIWHGAGAIGGFVVITLLTFIGLMAITFFIGRVIPIDPVLAVVGDREVENGTVALRRRDGSRQNGMAADEFVEMVVEKVESRSAELK